MIQKFKSYQFVRVAESCSNGGFAAIIHGSYADLFGGKDVKRYSLYKIEEDRIVDCQAWYDERHLELIDGGGLEKAAEMMADYDTRV